MNYTTKYHLPQWDETDRIMRTDFNQMCRDAEAGLDKVAADAASDTANAAASAAAAQATANKAVQDAAAAQATANAAYCPTNLPYTIGSYTGARAELTVRMGFQPRFLIIIYPANAYPYSYFYASGLGIDSQRVKLTATGFTVYPDVTDGNSTLVPPMLNIMGNQYIYIAFR